MPSSDERQQAVTAFLGDPATWGGAAVERHETHGAIVFLAGDRACKMKRAVRFPYMDYSTLERREEACRRELELNRRTAPQLYLSVEPVVRLADGALRLGGAGEAIEWVLMMRRFPQEGLLDVVATRGEMSRDLVVDLADEVARFHAAAARVDPAAPWGHSASVIEMLRENLAALEEAPDVFPAPEAAALGQATRDTFERIAPLLDARRAAGKVRRCHGDLHLGNVCLIDGAPTLFDAIEFNEGFTWIDVLYDVAFLLMDLEHRDLRAMSNAFFNRYVVAADEFAGLACLPRFLSARAMVRAKVAVSTAQAVPARRDALRAEARAYFDAASLYLTPQAPILVAVGGLSGTGKSTLAARLAPLVGVAPGAVHLRSDVLRKRQFGVAETDRLPESAYTAEASRRVFETMFEMAEAALSAGHSVVADAVFGDRWQREGLAAIAARTGARWRPIWLEAETGMLVSRVAARVGDASDATPAVVRRQASSVTAPDDWPRLSSGAGPDSVVAAARQMLGDL